MTFWHKFFPWHNCLLFINFRKSIYKDINSISRGLPWAPNWRNSLPYTVRTSRQRLCNQRVRCLQQLGSRASGPFERSGPRLLLTVSWGMTRMCLCVHQFFIMYVYLNTKNAISSVIICIKKDSRTNLNKIVAAVLIQHFCHLNISLNAIQCVHISFPHLYVCIFLWMKLLNIANLM